MLFRLPSLLILLIVLAGCASPPVPHALTAIAPNIGLPRSLLVQEIPGTALWQVVVQRQGQGLRFLRFNLLGIPDSRQILQDGHWQNDGFIAPNSDARELFAALLFALTTVEDLPLAYQQVQETSNVRALSINHQLRWTVTWQDRMAQSEAFSVKNHENGIVWQVRPMMQSTPIHLQPYKEE